MKVNIIKDEWYPFFIIETQLWEHRDIYEIPDELVYRYKIALSHLEEVQSELSKIYVKDNH